MNKVHIATFMIEINQNGEVPFKASRIAELRKEFAERQCVVLPHLLEDRLLQKVLRALDNATFNEGEYLASDKNRFASDQSIQAGDLAVTQLNFILNNRKFFDLVEQITSCSAIKAFSGRIYRNLPATEHYLDWHDDDTDEARLIGLSMNLSKSKFEGGIFQIRRTGSKRILREVGCGDLGDTHLFNISPRLEHRVSKTVGEFPRVAAAGWFMSEPTNLFEFLKRKRRGAASANSP